MPPCYLCGLGGDWVGMLRADVPTDVGVLDRRLHRCARWAGTVPSALPVLVFSACPAGVRGLVTMAGWGLVVPVLYYTVVLRTSEKRSRMLAAASLSVDSWDGTYLRYLFV